MNLIEAILSKAPSLKIAVVGDFIEDRYIIGEVDRISPEAPVPVVRVTNYKSTPGGAGNVFMNLLELGVQAHLFCDIGHLKDDIESSKEIVSTSRMHLMRKNHCVKTRVMSGNHHIVRYDDDVVPLWRDFSDMKWREDFEAWMLDWDAVIISDYNKGVVSDDVAERIINLCDQYKVPVIVDAKHNFMKFVGASILKCNGKEWASSPYRDARAFLIKSEIDKLVITHGELGMEIVLSTPESGQFSGHPVKIADTCGAGDTVTAILGICEAMKIDWRDSLPLSNRLAAEVCKYPGVYAIQKKDLMHVNESIRQPSI